MIPSPKIAIRVSAPPENRSMNERNPPAPCAWSASCRMSMSTTGTGMCEPSRYTAMMNSVKRILFRRSGTLNALTKALSTALYPTPSADQLGRAAGPLDLRPGGLAERVGPDRECLVQLAAGEHLDPTALVHEPVLEERRRVDLGVEVAGERLHVHDRV